MASSKVLLPIRRDSLITIPLRLRTATSVVPPPMSTTMDPFDVAISRPAPMAAASGSLDLDENFYGDQDFDMEDFDQEGFDIGGDASTPYEEEKF